MTGVATAAGVSGGAGAVFDEHVAAEFEQR